MPGTSVLIPTWNREEYLGEAIESVLCQTYQDFEIIVVDDGSTDGTAKLVKQYERVRYVWQPHGGISVARNRALAEARGDLIAWLDSDDLYVPDKLEKQAAYLDANSACDILFCLPQAFSKISDERMTVRQRWMTDREKEPLRTCLAGACIRKYLYDRFGGYNTRYLYLEDSEWLARVRLGGVDLGHCLEEYLYLRRVHDGQITFSHDMVNKRQMMAMYADVIRRNGRNRNDSNW